MSPIRIILVDDHAVVRAGLRSILAADPGFAIVGEAAAAGDAVAQVTREAPDVVLLDITMPGTSGLDAVPLLRAAAPGVAILMLSVHDDAEYVIRAVRAGAQGYVRKDTTPAELRAAVRAVHSGAGFFSPAIAGRLAVALRQEEPAEAGAALAALTGREREVLAGVARGLLNKEIAAKLGISVRTVEAHRDNVTRKLGIRSAAGLAGFAIAHGLVDPGGGTG